LDGSKCKWRALFTGLPRDPLPRVLLVEDEIILAESVVQGLGHSTYSAGSVVQATALLQDPGEIDLLFTDIRLPEGDLGGFELAQQARAKSPGLKVLYTTGDTVTDGMKVMFVEGGEMLPKPYTAPELAAAITRLLPGG
jgi:CheY-like chemotaxis protein